MRRISSSISLAPLRVSAASRWSLRIFLFCAKCQTTQAASEPCSPEVGTIAQPQSKEAQMQIRRTRTSFPTNALQGFDAALQNRAMAHSKQTRPNWVWSDSGSLRTFSSSFLRCFFRSMSAGCRVFLLFVMVFQEWCVLFGIVCEKGFV